MKKIGIITTRFLINLIIKTVKLIKNLFVFLFCAALFVSTFSFFTNTVNAIGCVSGSLSPLTATPSTIASPQDVYFSWPLNNGCEYLFIGSPQGVWTEVTGPVSMRVGPGETWELRGYYGQGVIFPSLVNSTTPNASASVLVQGFSPASLTVSVIDERNNLLSGASWTVSPNANPSSGSGESTVHSISPDANGAIYTVSGYPSSLQGKNLRSVTNTDGGGSSVFISSGQQKGVTIKYGAAQPPCTIDLFGNGNGGIINSSSGSPVTLTWSSTVANSTSGTGFSTGGATYNSSGVTVSPTTNTTYTINGVGSGGNCSDSVTVNITTTGNPAPGVDVKGNGSDGPVRLAAGESLTVSWTSSNAQSCEFISPFTSGVNTSGDATYGPGHSYYPSTSGTTYTVSCRNTNTSAITQDSVVVYAFTLSGPQATTVDLRANGSNGPVFIQSGAEVTLSWTTTGNPSSCTASSDPVNSNWSGSRSEFGGSQSSGPITSSQNTRFTITCDSATDSVEVGLNGQQSPLSYVIVSATPRNITSGEAVSVGWSTWGVTSCTRVASPANSNWTGAVSLSQGGISQDSRSITLTQTTTFTLNCNTPQGPRSASDTVTVYPAGSAPQITFDANPNTVNMFQTTNLGWNVLFADSCTASAVPANSNWSGPKSAILGSQTSSPINLNTVFTLSCSGPGGNSQASEPVTLTSQNVNLGANPTTVNYGETTNLTWTTVSAWRCEASTLNTQDFNWFGWVPTNGTRTSSALTMTNTYSISCYDSLDNFVGSDSETITVIPASSASVRVNSNRPSSWTLSPRATPAAGSGTSALHTIANPSGGLQVILSGIQAINGYNYNVTNSQGGGSSMIMFPGGAETFTITYVPSSGTFDYALSNNGNVSITKSGSSSSGQSVVTASLISNPTQPVTFSALGAPSGVIVSYANQGCLPTCSATITFTVPSSVPVGTYPITVTGSAAGIVRSTVFNLVISAPAGISATCSASPSPAYIGQPVTWSANVSGGTPPYSYAWSGTNFPGTPTSNPYVISYQTTGAKTASVTVTDGNGVTATCPTASLQIGINPLYEEF